MRITKFIMVLVFITGTMFSQAQLEKGKIFLSGSSSIKLHAGSQKSKSGSTSEANYSYTDFYFQPAAGYFVIDNLSVGLFMDWNMWCEKPKDDYGYDYRSMSFTFGPFVRYYFLDLNGFRPYAMAAIGFGVDNYKSREHPDGEWYKDNEGLFTYRFGGGGTYFCTDRVGIDAFLGFNHEAYTEKDNDDGASRASDKTKYIYNEFIMQFGVIVILGKP